MSARQHRFLMAVSGILIGIAGIVSGTDPSALGIPERAVGWFSVGVAALLLIGNELRRYGDQ